MSTFYRDLRCFDTVFQRPYRYFSIVLKVFSSLPDRYNIFTSNWCWIEICEDVVLSKIDITMATIKQIKWKLIEAEFFAI